MPRVIRLNPNEKPSIFIEYAIITGYKKEKDVQAMFNVNAQPLNQVHYGFYKREPETGKDIERVYLSKDLDLIHIKNSENIKVRWGAEKGGTFVFSGPEKYGDIPWEWDHIYKKTPKEFWAESKSITVYYTTKQPFVYVTGIDKSSGEPHLLILNAPQTSWSAELYTFNLRIHLGDYKNAYAKPEKPKFLLPQELLPPPIIDPLSFFNLPPPFVYPESETEEEEEEGIPSPFGESEEEWSEKEHFGESESPAEEPLYEGEPPAVEMRPNYTKEEDEGFLRRMDIYGTIYPERFLGPEQGFAYNKALTIMRRQHSRSANPDVTSAIFLIFVRKIFGVANDTPKPSTNTGYWNYLFMKEVIGCQLNEYFDDFLEYLHTYVSQFCILSFVNYVTLFMKDYESMIYRTLLQFFKIARKVFPDVGITLLPVKGLGLHLSCVQNDDFWIKYKPKLIFYTTDEFQIELEKCSESIESFIIELSKTKNFQGGRFLSILFTILRALDNPSYYKQQSEEEEHEEEEEEEEEEE